MKHNPHPVAGRTARVVVNCFNSVFSGAACCLGWEIRASKLWRVSWVIDRTPTFPGRAHLVRQREWVPRGSRVGESEQPAAPALRWVRGGYSRGRATAKRVRLYINSWWSGRKDFSALLVDIRARLRHPEPCLWRILVFFFTGPRFGRPKKGDPVRAARSVESERAFRGVASERERQRERGKRSCCVWGLNCTGNCAVWSALRISSVRSVAQCSSAAVKWRGW